MVGMFEMFHARLTGIAHCIVPQILPIPVDPQGTNILQQPPMEFLQNIMQPLLPDQMPMVHPPPSIVQIVVPANVLPHGHGLAGEKIIVSTEETPTTSVQPIIENLTHETTTSHNEVSTQEPQKTTSSYSTVSSSTPYPDDDIDEMILNEDLDGEYHQGGEDNVKKQRDRSDFRYVESFEPEKSNSQQFEPDHSENDGANVINENFSQIPSVLPVPKALSSPKEVSSTELDEIPPDAMIQDEGTADNS
jgi:hypothetical protein